MLHVALATVHNADILVSWNFRHIVHFDTIAKFNAVNMEYGFRQWFVRSGTSGTPRQPARHLSKYVSITGKNHTGLSRASRRSLQVRTDEGVDCPTLRSILRCLRRNK